MFCICGFDFTLLIALMAAIATLLSVRFQIFTMINTQLSDKAKECNQYLMGNCQLSMEVHKISGIVSAIITAKQLLNHHLKNKQYHILVGINKQSFIEQFYLQLNTTIQGWIKSNEFDKFSLIFEKTESESSIRINNEIKNTIERQYNQSREFLIDSIGLK